MGILDSLKEGSIKFSYDAQFKRCKEIGKKETVFIIAGMGEDRDCLIGR